MKNASRRVFLGGLPALGSLAHVKVASGAPGRSADSERIDQAYRIRMQSASRNRDKGYPIPEQSPDERRHDGYVACFTKGLPHNERGEVDVAAYDRYLDAIASGTLEAFNALPMGGTVKLVDPLASYGFTLEGSDPWQCTLPAPPGIASQEGAAELIEVYWQALTRDIPFREWDNHPLIQRAMRELSSIPQFAGPKENGRVTLKTLFRGTTPGELVGPYVSQFFWKDIIYGVTPIAQKYRTTEPGSDHMISVADWLAVQNGRPPVTAARFDSTLRYIRNSRDLCIWDWRDFSYQGPLNAALILLGIPGALKSNQYSTSPSMGGFVIFGGPFVLDLVARVSNAALRAAWRQKWTLHRKLRPEEYAGLVHFQREGQAKYPIESDFLLKSDAIAESKLRHGTYLIPQAYPEGSPLHTSYPSGHASIAGAAVTVLKALFREDMPIPNPVQATTDGLALEPWTGEPLTIGGELNKLASNMGIARNIAGIHYLSDAMGGLALGEQVAISILADTLPTLPFATDGLRFTSFSGREVFIG